MVERTNNGNYWREEIEESTSPSALHTSLRVSPVNSNRDSWQYSDRLKWYLLSLGNGDISLEDVGGYPVSMRFPKYWNDTLNEMVENTRKDKHEWFCVVGVDRLNQRVLIPRRVAQGGLKMISHNLHKEQVDLAKEAGADMIIGSFHTHPSRHEYRGLIKRFFLANSLLSAHDFYALLVHDEEVFSGAVQTNKQDALIFKSRQTKVEKDMTYLPPGYRDQNSFADYWYRTLGYKYNPEEQTTERVDKKSVSTDEWNDAMWEVNLAISRKHHLAIYRGNVGFGLGRFYPPSTNSQYDDFLKGKTSKVPELPKL